MAKKTSVWEIPYPELTDMANVPEIMENLAETVDTALTTLKNSILACFPIGTIIQSSVNNNPANYIGGTWELITDRFLIGAGNKYTVNATGGEETVTLTTSQIPSHNHIFTGASCTTSSAGSHNHTVGGSVANITNCEIVGSTGICMSENPVISTTSSAGSHNHTLTPSGTISSTGGGGSHNNMPPYQAVYMWKRTA